MKLGKCPICKKEIEIIKTIDVDGFKRYDPKCDTDGCMVNGLEWNYEDRDKLISMIIRSQELAGIEAEDFVSNLKTKKLIINKRKKKSTKTHYNYKEKPVCGKGQRLSKDPKDIDCGNCLNNNYFKKKFGLP